MGTDTTITHLAKLASKTREGGSRAHGGGRSASRPGQSQVLIVQVQSHAAQESNGREQRKRKTRGVKGFADGGVDDASAKGIDEKEKKSERSRIDSRAICFARD